MVIFNRSKVILSVKVHQYCCFMNLCFLYHVSVSLVEIDNSL